MQYEMELLTLGEETELSQKGEQALQWFQEHGCQRKVETWSRRDGYVRMKLSVQRDEKEKSERYSSEQLAMIFRRQMAEFLTENILQEWSRYWMNRYLTAFTLELSPQGKKAVAEKCQALLQEGKTNGGFLPEYACYNQKCRICMEIEDYLQENKMQCIHIEGWVRFRMQDFLREMRDTVKLSCQCWENEQEYSGFVEMMKEWMYEQQESIETVNLLFYPEGGFCLWDENGQRMYDEEMTGRQKNFLLQGDEVLLSLILSAAPQQIVWHMGSQNVPQRQITRILQDVFGNRLSFCRDCCLCRSAAAVQQYQPQ